MIIPYPFVGEGEKTLKQVFKIKKNFTKFLLLKNNSDKEEWNK